MTTAGVIVGWVIAALGGLAAVAALLKVGPERRKIAADARRAGADATQVLASTAMSLLKPSQDQIDFLRSELAAAQDEITALRSELAGCAPETRTEPPREDRQPRRIGREV